jgi:hypothetical protein
MASLPRLLAFGLLSSLIGSSFIACGDDGEGTTGSGAGTGQGGEDGNNGICIAHNCQEDSHCEGCADDKNTCRIEAGEESGRCVACGDGASGCPSGYECSSWGNCVPEGLECPTENGVPQITCSSSADCAACDPAHLVCDTATGQCVACTQNDTSECQSTDICKDGQCASACGTDCLVDNDCMQCPGAKACNSHKCSECSATYACPAGETCDLTTGTCQKVCGELEAPGTCDMSTDCALCGGMQNTCHIPLGSTSGTCGPNAAGCSDLGAGALALPAPFNQVTQTCSNDMDCTSFGAGVQYNVGEALRELLGTDEIVGQQIGDAFLEYPMPVCGAVTLADTSCGFCVPCREDSDCSDIDIDSLSGQLFPGVGGALLAFVYDQIFGPEEHKIYMYCESVAAGYGACLPCPGLLNDCAPGGGGGGGGGTCDHPTDQTGGPLNATCDACTEEICGFDPYCCETAWDQTCVQEAADNCGTGSCHDVCDTGAPMGAECGTCEGDVCANDDYCCTTSWDSLCVDAAVMLCGESC